MSLLMGLGSAWGQPLVGSYGSVGSIRLFDVSVWYTRRHLQLNKFVLLGKCIKWGEELGLVPFAWRAVLGVVMCGCVRSAEGRFWRGEVR
jgi:hypothetical protein